MRHAIITTPFPSIESTAAQLGVGTSRVRQLEKLVDTVLKKRAIEETIAEIYKREGKDLRRLRGINSHATARPMRAKAQDVRALSEAKRAKRK